MSAFEKKSKRRSDQPRARGDIAPPRNEEEKSGDDSGFFVQFKSADDFSFTTSRQRAILNK